MGDKVKYLFKNMGILTLSNFSSKLLVFFLVPLYTSVLSTAEYGAYDLSVSTITLVYPIVTLNIVDAVMRFCMDKSYSKTDIVRIGFRKILLSIGIAGAVLFLIRQFKVFPAVSGLETLVFVYYVCFVINQFFVQLAKGMEKVTVMGIAGVIGTIIMIGGNLLFLLVFKMGLKGFFAANILAQLIPALFYFISLRFWQFFDFKKADKQLEKEMLLYCLPLLFTTLGWAINSAADKYVVSLLCGVAAEGLLSVAYKIPGIINTVQGIFVQAWQISAIKEYGDKSTPDFYGRTFMVTNVLMTLMCSGLILLSKPLAHILYLKDFYHAWQYAPFLLISTVLNSASGFVGPILAAKKDSKSMAYSSIYGSIFNIILNVGLVFLIGIQGATIATALSSYVIYHFRLKAAREDIKIQSYWRVLVSWSLLVVEALLEIYTNLWFVEIVVILVLLVINRKSIIEIVKSFLSLIKKTKGKTE